MIPVSRRKLVGGRTNSVENMFVKLDHLLTRQNIFETSHLVFFYLDTKMCTHFGIKIDPPQSSRIQWSLETRVSKRFIDSNLNQQRFSSLTNPKNLMRIATQKSGNKALLTTLVL